MKKHYNIIIAGGGTSGCACAYIAAKLGLKVLLLEQKSYLGGAISSQLVIPAMKTQHQNFNQEFFNDLCLTLNKKMCQITYGDGNEGWFNPIVIPSVLQEMLTSVGCDVHLHTNIKKIKCNNKKHFASKYIDNKTCKETEILSLGIETKYDNNKDNFVNEDDILLISTDAKYSRNNRDSLTNFSGDFFVDSTGNGNFSELCNAEFLPYENISQAWSLRFILNGVDKYKFSNWLKKIDSNTDITTVFEINADIHLSTAYTWDKDKNWALRPFFDDAVEKGILKDTDRAYFQLFSIPGMPEAIAFNCPRIMSKNSLNYSSKEDLEMAKMLGIEAITRLYSFCKKYFPGFESSTIYKIADDIGIRESRRVLGKYILTKEDILEAKTFEHPVAISNYPIDIHSIKQDKSTLNYVQKPYQVPLESLMVKGFKNLFVAGRCLSADFHAQAAVRIQPTCFSMGESIARYVNKIITYAQEH